MAHEVIEYREVPKITPGRWRLRDGREAIIERVGKLVGSGRIGNDRHTWNLYGGWNFSSPQEHRMDLVERIGD